MRIQFGVRDTSRACTLPSKVHLFLCAVRDLLSSLTFNTSIPFSVAVCAFRVPLLQVTEDVAKSLVEKLYGKAVSTVCKLDSYDDMNFKIDTSSGESYTLKVKNACLQHVFFCTGV